MNAAAPATARIRCRGKETGIQMYNATRKMDDHTPTHQWQLNNIPIQWRHPEPIISTFLITCPDSSGSYVIFTNGSRMTDVISSKTMRCVRRNEAKIKTTKCNHEMSNNGISPLSKRYRDSVAGWNLKVTIFKKNHSLHGYRLPFFRLRNGKLEVGKRLHFSRDNP
jgi:hypothetical protein